MAKIVRPFILLPPQFGKIAQRDLRHVRDQKRQLEGAGCFISGDSGKKAQGCSWHPQSFSESAAPESRLMHAPPGAGKPTVVLSGFAGCTAEVGMVFFLLLYHFGAIVSRQLRAPDHSFFMHTLYVHSSGASVTVSVTMLPVVPAIWKVEFNHFPLNLDWPLNYLKRRMCPKWLSATSEAIS